MASVYSSEISAIAAFDTMTVAPLRMADLADAARLERINIGSRLLIEIVEQRPVSNLSDHVQKALFDDVLVDRHNAGLPRFNRACIRCEPHDVKVTTRFDDDPAKLGYLPGARTRVSAKP